MLHLLAQTVSNGGGSSTVVQGGVAAGVLAFAGAVVKGILGLYNRSEARGDRLEAAALAAVPALSAANIAQAAQTETIAQLSRRIEDLLRERRP